MISTLDCQSIFTNLYNDTFCSYYRYPLLPNHLTTYPQAGDETQPQDIFRPKIFAKVHDKHVMSVCVVQLAGS